MSATPGCPSVRVRSLIVPVLLAVGACAPDPGRPDLEARAFLAVVAAEDMRHTAGRTLDVLREATRSPHASLRRVGVRALGRLESPDLAPHVATLLDDPDPAVRAEAANALAQSVHRGAGDEAVGSLLSRVSVEAHPGVRASLARSLGRLRVDASTRRRVGAELVTLSRGPSGRVAAPIEVLGATLGMESFLRRGAGAPAPAALTARVAQLTGYGEGAIRTAARVRRVAYTALPRTGLLKAEDVSRGLSDADAGVRRAAVAAAAGLTEPTRAELGTAALADPSAQVRAEGVRLLAGAARSTPTCSALLDVALADGNTGVRLAALDALAVPCPDRTPQLRALEGAAATLTRSPEADWHVGAHGLHSLTSLDRAAGALRLPDALGHPNPFARAWGARTATLLGDVDALRGLLADPSSNVVSAAVAGLAASQGGDADSLLIDVLSRSDDEQVVVILAPLLQDTDRSDPAAEAGLGALRRLSEGRRDTTRDPRIALLDLIEVTADSVHLSDVEPYLRDYDPVVAVRAARVMESWTGKRFLGAGRGTPRLALPGAEELREMERSSVVLHMARGGSIEIALLPREAPTNAYRLFRMAREGVLDGLTLHRVVPNFVVQGGSPRANEYGGHGAYTRDEVGLRVQWRGTVGLSTRGRDTGDGQIYFNLIDNVRLDHDYTLMGVVRDGMETVDAVLEGDVIERTELRSRDTSR